MLRYQSSQLIPKTKGYLRMRPGTPLRLMMRRTSKVPGVRRLRPEVPNEMATCVVGPSFLFLYLAPPSTPASILVSLL